MPVDPSPFAFLLGEEIIDTTLDEVDARHLALALAEARKGVGRTAPNPPVGAVVARGAEVLATGFHPRAGERHAEVVALDALKAKDPGAARGATLYVTLEPCVHHGKTPPCSDRVLAEGIARVVIGAVDPNPRVHEKGIAALRAAGVRVDVATGPLGAACRALIAPFTRTIVDGRPWVLLKVATTLDGRVAAHTGKSRWITGQDARDVVHELRNVVDTVMVGAGTVLADDPRLTARLDPSAPGEGAARLRDPRRVVVDGGLRTLPTARVFSKPDVCRSDDTPPLVIHGRAPADRIAAFDAAGIARLERASSEGRVDLDAALRHLSQGAFPKSLAVLVEAGPGLATALLQRGLVDELWWFTAPFVLGGDALPAVAPLGFDAPADAPRFVPVHRAVLGDDALVVLRPSSAS